TIGGTAAAARNVISAPSNGVGISESGNVKVQGNYIGTDASGAKALAINSGFIGVDGGGPNTTIGGTAIGSGNLISCNGANVCTNVFIEGSGVLVQGNLIGTDIGGTAALGTNSIGVQT